MKTNKISKTIALILVTITTGFTAMAQDATLATPKAKFALEIDPATFAFKGYGVHFRYKPKNSDHMLIGVGTYAMDMPDMLVDFNKENKSKNWNVRLNQGYSAFIEYHFSEVNRKLFIGSQVGVQEYKIENDYLNGNTRYSNLLVMGYFGYTIRPFDFDFYIKPWAGIGYTTKISGENILQGVEYNNAPITMFATLHFGYMF